MTAQFKAPKYEPPAKRLAEIPFSGTVAAGAYLTLVTSKIMYPYRVIRVKMFFPAVAANLVSHRWYVALNPVVSVTDWPADTNLFGRESPTATFIGQSLIRQVAANVKVEEIGTYLKFSTFNGLGVAYVANGSITIEEV